MSKISSKLASIRKEITREFDLKFFGHTFKAKFLSEKEEQLIMEYISKANFANYRFISKLSTLQLAFSLVSIDGEAVYVEEDNKDEETITKSRLDIVADFEHWDSDVLFSLLKEMKTIRDTERKALAKQAGMSDEEIARLTRSTLDQITEDTVTEAPVEPPPPEIPAKDELQSQ